MGSLAVIVVLTVASENVNSLVTTKYIECSTMQLHGETKVSDATCPERHYCHGGHGMCFPCSTCKGQDCRRMTFEPQCAKAAPFSYHMSISNPQYTPACSVASLLSFLNTSEAIRGVKVEWCQSGCDDLAMDGGKRCFPGTSCRLACQKGSLVPSSWTALCNCSYQGNIATCDWIQKPEVCNPVSTQPTARAETKTPYGSTKEVAIPTSPVDVTFRTAYSKDAAFHGQLTGSNHMDLGVPVALESKMATIHEPLTTEEWVFIITLVCLMMIVMMPFAFHAIKKDCGNTSNVTIINNSCNQQEIKLVCGESPELQDENADVAVRSYDSDFDNTTIPMLIYSTLDNDPFPDGFAFTPEHGINEPLGTAAHPAGNTLNEVQPVMVTASYGDRV